MIPSQTKQPYAVQLLHHIPQPYTTNQVATSSNNAIGLGIAHSNASDALTDDDILRNSNRKNILPDQNECNLITGTGDSINSGRVNQSFNTPHPTYQNNDNVDTNSAYNNQDGSNHADEKNSGIDDDDHGNDVNDDRDDSEDSEDSDDNEDCGGSDSSGEHDNGEGGKNDEDSTIEDTEREEGIFAFQSALNAEVAAGSTVYDAVITLFESSHNTAQSDSFPILAALQSDPSLASDLNLVARMCFSIFSVSDQSRRDGVVQEPQSVSLSSLDDVISLVARSSSIVVLTGAGISVSCGIPDFRSKGGVYDTIRLKYNLPEPQVTFDIDEFHNDPTVFYSVAKHIMPAPSLKPSPTHYFISQLATRNKLLRNYSQNIDGLESRAGVPQDRLVLCHGSFLSASCTHKKCNNTVTGSEIANDVLAGEVPFCLECTQRVHYKKTKRRKRSYPQKQLSFSDEDSGDDDEPDIGIMKPNIVFFGEKLSEDVEDCMKRDALQADLVIVMGTSLKIKPVSNMLSYFPESVPQMLINRELVGYDFDVELMGNCDTVIKHLFDGLGWDNCGNLNSDVRQLEESSGGTTSSDTSRVNGDSQVISRSSEYDTVKLTGSINGGDSHSEEVKFIPPRRFIFDGAARSGASAG